MGVSTSTVLWGGTTTRNYHTLQHQAEWLWKIQCNGARVDVRQYDRSQAGADYIAKCLGANAYELNKYSFANTVTLSSSVIRLIASIDESGERRCGIGHMKKRDGLEMFGILAKQSTICDETSSLD